MVNEMNISSIFFFMPVISFLFVFVVVFAILAKTKILGDGRVNVIVSFIMAIIFMNFSSLDLFVRTITPWFIVLLICLFFILVVLGFSTKSLDKIMTPGFGWAFVIILIIVFLIAAIRVFNPVFHPSLILTSGGEGSPGIIWQIRQMLDSQIMGSILLLVVGGVVAWVLTKK
ncbi:Uncharacterised protein [uncultured archaeon]|nr:Uncharacterised protein [uncultured archaeon]